MVASALFSAALLAGLNLVPADMGGGDVFQFGQPIASPSQEPAEAPSPSEAPAPAPSDNPSGVIVVGGSASGTTTVNESAGRCFAISFGYSEVNNQMAIAESVAEISSYVCGDESVNEDKVGDIAEATATAFAVAVAEASVFCEATGDTQFYANAYANATAAADVWLKAYASAFASSTVCGKCEALAESFGYIEQEVFLKAVAASEATVNGYSTASATRLFSLAREFNVDVQAATTTAFAQAISNAKTYYDSNECYAWVNSNGCIWTPSASDPEMCFECEAVSIGATTAMGIDAISTAVTAAVAYTCGTNSSAEAEAYVAASALAYATAEAMSFAYASCSVDDIPDAYACSASLVAAEDTARAVAEAFAESWALGSTCEETCTVESDVAARSIGSILVTATSNALVALCAAEGEMWTVDVLVQAVESASLEAVASAIASAVVGDECFAAGGVDVSVGVPGK